MSNLLPGVRDWTMEYFRQAGIPWHHGVGGQPGNHLLSSQVQCVNALAPMAYDPDAVRTTFGGVLDIAEVLPFGDEVEPSSHVAFEWIGLDDHLNEHPGTAGSRGANFTSADAAIRYRTTAGHIEIALIEWKFTESYSGERLSGGAAARAKREVRYSPLLRDPASPIRIDLLALDDMLVEPLYQLMRLQLLAWRMEAARELDAEVVRLVYAASSRNQALWQSLTPKQRELGDDLRGVWRTMLRQPDRFVLFDTAALVADDSVSSDEFKARYSALGPAIERDHRSRDQVEAEAQAAIDWAQTVFLRLAADGGVLSQALDEGVLARASTGALLELTNRANEAAELARRLRERDLGGVLSPEPDAWGQ